MKILIIFAVLMMLIPFSSAATYYISPTGNDLTGNGSSANPWQTISKGCRSIVSGDTLILKDGIYRGNDNMFNFHNGNYPPSGSLANSTIIKAEHIGQAIIDGEMARIPFDGHNSDYLTIEGIIFMRSNESVFSLNGGASNYCTHIKILKCGFSDANNRDTGQPYEGRAFPFIVRYLDNSLVEDSYVWGNGMYHFLILDSDKIILRRCIDRYDRGYGEEYSLMSSFRLYGTTNSLVQNCISIDSDQPQFIRSLGTSPGYPKLIWFGPNDSTNFPAANNTVTGTIILNCVANSYIGFMGNDRLFNNSIRNSVFWNVSNGFWQRSYINISDKIYFDHCTFGNLNMTNGLAKNALRTDAVGFTEATNSLFYGTGSNAILNTISNYNAFYNNYQNYGGSSSAGANDYCSQNSNAIDPIDGNPGNGIPALKYITRIEPGSNLYNSGSFGNRGATIVNRIGVSGTLWGEVGYDTVTSESLWPWPYEDVIKAHMKSYYYSEGNLSISGNRGFAADGNGLYGGNITLTSYIWEYLGNPCPADICNYTQTNQTQNQTIYHAADTNQNSYIEISEIMDYVRQFKLGTVTRTNVLDGVMNFFKGRYN